MTPGEAIRAGLTEAERTWTRISDDEWHRSDGAACYRDHDRGGWWAIGHTCWPAIKEGTAEAAMAALDGAG